VITGVRGWSNLPQGGPIIFYASATERILAFVTAVTFGVAAYGCMRRTKWAWGFVRGILWVAFGVSVLWLPVVLFGFFTATDNRYSIIDVVLPSFFQIAIWGWLLFYFWRWQRQKFPMAASIMPPAGQEPKQ
jgi:hypothetical protein